MGGASDPGQNWWQAEMEGRKQESNRQHSPGESLRRRVLLQRVGIYVQWNLGNRDTQRTVENRPEFWGGLISQVHFFDK